ncbi:hypothetical protein RB195_007594 [Necator americanus]|uniref:Uncharacterized protein n=1 Tax=Necator americanus TaxID=51031 RepID=A0ABR1BY00_NECAM
MKKVHSSDVVEVKSFKCCDIDTVGPKRHEARCICVSARNSAVKAAVETKLGPSQAKAIGGASKGFTTLLAAPLHRSSSIEAAYAIAYVLHVVLIHWNMQFRMVGGQFPPVASAVILETLTDCTRMIGQKRGE